MKNLTTITNLNSRHMIMPAGALLIFSVFIFIPDRVQAHVKWFSEFSFIDQPRTFLQILTPVYLSMIVLSIIVISAMVYLERTLAKAGWYGRLNRWLAEREIYSMLVMRIAMAAVLLISWASDAVLTPELESPQAWLSWIQFALAIGLMFPKTTWLSGAGLLVLYLVTIFEFGVFHMLDYLHYAGIGIYFLVSEFEDKKISGLALPALYATIGFSLIWLGYEKLVYPDWAIYLLEQNPQLTLGFQPGFFLQAAAFVELALGYLLIIGLLERPLAATITLVFFLTTLVFGKIEVIGHTPLHAALIVFLFNGPGAFYKPPIAIHEKLSWRVSFGAVNFVIAMLIFGLAYTASAQWQYSTAVANAQTNPEVMDLANLEVVPQFMALEAFEDGNGHWTLNAQIDGFTFTPELVGGPVFPGQGHVVVYDNGDEVGRMLTPWFDLGRLNPGKHNIVVILNGNDGTDFANGTKLIGKEIEIIAK